MSLKRILLNAAAIALLGASAARGDSERRSAYSYVRESTGSVTVVSELNGSVEARRNLPISAGDVVRTDDPARAEVAMADGNLVQIGGGTELKFVSLSGQQGSDDEVSALDLSGGSVILSVIGNDERSVPRIDTSDATVYASLGSRVRVNTDSRRGTAVIVRAGSVEVRTRAGSYTVRAGNYLTVKEDEEPEIARGDFSHDRFDGWAAERLELNSESTRGASSRYVGEDYSGDVQALDGYGDWDYNSTYSMNVWRPHVSAGWSPYSSGSWYYTPIGLTWWSSDPWGWYPYHYGNWFFDAGWNSWCWSPGYLYSPAWVYWGYTSGYVGWCPLGWIGFHSPWWNNYYRNWSYPRAGLAFAINGNFSTRRVDFRGWNFTGTSNLGTTGRMPIVQGTRVVDRLGAQMAVSSRPIVVNARPGAVRESLREFVREAPRTIERTAGRDSARLEPVLAHDAKLPSETVDALRERAVTVDRGRLSGAGAREIAPRGTAVVERGTGAVHIETTQRGDRSPGRTVITDRGGNEGSVPRGREAIAPDRGGRGEIRGAAPRPEAQDSWRSRSGSVGERTTRPEAPRTVERDRPGTTQGPEVREAAPSSRERAEAWRGGSRQAAPPPRDAPVTRGGQSWRSRTDVPPARRVIDGAVPGRRAPEASGRSADNWRQAPAPRDLGPRDRDLAPRGREAAPRERDFSPRDRDLATRNREAPRAFRQEPAPREFAPRAPKEAPRSFERAPARESAPRAAPPSRSEPRSAPPRSAPPPSHGRPGRN